jgi:magnesium-protoporphyrin O-methyltransferase
MASCCALSEHHFTEAIAECDLGRDRRGKLNAPTRKLLRALRDHAPEPASVLDVGGGVGVMLHELLPGRATTATYVEAASAYLRVAREEAVQRGYASRVRFLHGDFLDLVEGVPPAEVVVLNRVVCCYPDAERLLTAASGRSLHWVAMSYPRDGWFVRLGDRFANWQRQRRGDPFRTYVHEEDRIHEALLRAGFERRVRCATPLWRVALYDRLADD